MSNLFRRGDRVRTAILAAGAVAIALTLACPTNLPTQVLGPTVIGNDPPTMEITAPNADFSVSQGDSFVITWRDSDADSAALISFDLVDVDTGSEISVVRGIEENDRTGPDSFRVSTGLLPQSDYYIRGTITDGINTPFSTYAQSADVLGQRVVLTITPPGLVPPSAPPRVYVAEPRFNQSVAQDDPLNVVVQPVAVQPDPANPIPYDPDTDATLYIVADLNNTPDDDSVLTPLPNEVILLRRIEIPVGSADVQPGAPIAVDLGELPPRPDGSPYFIRATIDDSTNPQVHSYAPGTINVVRYAGASADEDFVDLARAGKTIAGARFLGFNPGSNLGTTITSVLDFDLDGADDFFLVAQFGNPRNQGNIGEAYLIYGLTDERYGGDINVNSVSTSVPGAIFEAPPPRLSFFNGIEEAITYGITDAGVVPDLDGDGRPEILIGLAHVEGIFQGRDDDPCDCPPEDGGDDTEEVTIVVRQGSYQITVGDSSAGGGTYSEFSDATIDSAAPNTNFGNALDLEWDNDGVGDRSWVVLKLEDLLTIIPDAAAQIEDLSATLAVRVVNTGGNAQAHELFTDFIESTVTFNNFAENGGEPEPDVDYDAEALGDLNGTAVGSVTVEVTAVIQKLIDGELAPSNDVQLILVAAEDATDNVTVRSSEYSAVPDDRPTLTIQYSRPVFRSSIGCYPDDFVNNFTSEVPGDDESFEALGCATLLSSRNRDNAGIINPDRLADTVVTIELIGQEAQLLGGAVSAEAQFDEGSRIDGHRFQAGWYDFVDHRLLNQPPLWDLFGWNVSSIADMDNDQQPELIFSAPLNEQDVIDTFENFGSLSTHLASRPYRGSIMVLTGTDYDQDFWRDKPGENAITPHPRDENDCPGDPGACGEDPVPRCGTWVPEQQFEIFAEDSLDFLQDGQSAGDVNLDSVPDILCGAPFNDRSADLEDSGVTYVIYGRTPIGDYFLFTADDPLLRPPMIRIRGETAHDRLGWAQEAVLDVNGDRIDDIVLSSPYTDFGGIRPLTCGGDFNGDGQVDDDDLDTAAFNGCEATFGDEVFFEDDCKAFDYNNDRRIDDDDREVLECLLADGGVDCCPADNGFIGVVFGGVTLDGDREISQIATPDLPGAIFYSTTAGHLAGWDVASAGDFNRDGYGDLIIAVPGEMRVDDNGRDRLGVAYLIFGGPHLQNASRTLDQVGTAALPGLVFVTPFIAGRPNEAPIETVAGIGDINNDGFDDIAFGIPQADFIDQVLPQDPNDPGTDPSIGRRPDDGNVVIIYGSNQAGVR